MPEHTYGVGPAAEGGKNVGRDHSQVSRLGPYGRVYNKEGALIFDPTSNLIKLVEEDVSGGIAEFRWPGFPQGRGGNGIDIYHVLINKTEAEYYEYVMPILSLSPELEVADYQDSGDTYPGIMSITKTYSPISGTLTLSIDPELDYPTAGMVGDQRVYVVEGFQLLVGEYYITVTDYDALPPEIAENIEQVMESNRLDPFLIYHPTAAYSIDGANGVFPVNQTALFAPGTTLQFVSDGGTVIVDIDNNYSDL